MDKSGRSGSASDSKRALVLTCDVLGSQVCIRLALEGYAVLAIGSNEANLKRTHKEIGEFGGFYGYLVADLCDPEQAGQVVQAIFEHFAGAHYVIHAAGSQPIGTPLRLPYAVYEERVTASTQARDTFNRAFVSEYQARLQAGSHVATFEHVIDVADGAPDRSRNAAGPGIATRGGWPGGTRYSRLYAGSPALPENRVDLLVPSEEYLALWYDLSDEVVHLLADGVYGDAAAVSLRTMEDAVYACLHPLGRDGRPDLAQWVRRFKRAKPSRVYVNRGLTGKGLFAAQDFRQGEFIVPTIGKIIPFQTEHSVQIGLDSHIEVVSPVRFLNHSCDPNAGMKTNVGGLPDLFAMRDIQAGEEITFDYAMTEFKHYERSDPALEFSLACRCGSERCRGRLGYYSELPADRKKNYAGFISDYLVKLDE